MEANPKVETSETKNSVPDKPQDNSASRKRDVSNAGHSASSVGFSGAESDNLSKDATKSENLIKNANYDKISSESKSGVRQGLKRDNSHLLKSDESERKLITVNDSDDTVSHGGRIARRVAVQHRGRMKQTARKTVLGKVDYLNKDDDDGYSEYLSSESEEEDDPEHLNKDVPKSYTSDYLSDADFEKYFASGNAKIGQSNLLGNTNYKSLNKEAPKSRSPANENVQYSKLSLLSNTNNKKSVSPPKSVQNEMKTTSNGKPLAKRFMNKSEYDRIPPSSRKGLRPEKILAYGYMEKSKGEFCKVKWFVGFFLISLVNFIW